MAWYVKEKLSNIKGQDRTSATLFDLVDDIQDNDSQGKDILNEICEEKTVENEHKKRSLNSKSMEKREEKPTKN